MQSCTNNDWSKDMSKFIKKASKGVSDAGAGAAKMAFTAVLGDIIKEIMEESGVTAIAKDKLMAAGHKVIKELGIDPRNIQKELIKQALKSELKLS